MTRPTRMMKCLLAVLVWTLSINVHALAADAHAASGSSTASDRLELGRRMYMEGVLPSGKTMTATIQGDIPVTGQQVVCGACHRRSGMGSSEGQDVVPMVIGDILYNPLRLPVSKPPLPPELRPAYTDATLKRSIRDGIDASGNALGPLMPRYALTDDELDILLGYLKTLSTEAAPGVTAEDIHFATIVADGVPAVTRKAHLDVMEAFFKQKNAGTRNESSRSRNSPWHKDAFLKSYRKWRLHVWELKGPAETWPEQLAAYYREQPAFAVLSGMVPGSWAPVHTFCKQEQLPCLFPTTRLPVVNEQDFYSVYFSRGMTQEGEVIAQHLLDEQPDDRPVVQVVRAGDAAGITAAEALRHRLEDRQRLVTDVVLPVAGADAAFWRKTLEQGREAVLVLWLDEPGLTGLWEQLDNQGPPRLYLSTSLYSKPDNVPVTARERVYLYIPMNYPARCGFCWRARPAGCACSASIHPPNSRQRLFHAENGRRGACPDAWVFQSRGILLEQIEHMVDNAFYTSVYPRMSLAPGQRFVVKGGNRWLPADGAGKLKAVSDWLIPGRS